jgi:hypothetical protein
MVKNQKCCLLILNNISVLKTRTVRIMERKNGGDEGAGEVGEKCPMPHAHI